MNPLALKCSIIFFLLGLFACNSNVNESTDEILQDMEETIQTPMDTIATINEGDSTLILLDTIPANVDAKIIASIKKTLTEKKAPLPSTETKANDSKVISSPTNTVLPNFNHQKWNNLLGKYVTSSGKVNYAGFKEDKAALATYLEELQAEYTNLNSWSTNKKLAYWLNVYNAYTIKLIIDNYPVKSIKDIQKGTPWDYRFISLGGNTYTLNDIENGIIRKQFNDSRIHVGVNCASISCPKLSNEAFTEQNVNTKLTKLMTLWLADKSKNDISENTLKLSYIFDWYKQDFTKNGTVQDFIQGYTPQTIATNAPITYLDYNWNLNE